MGIHGGAIDTRYSTAAARTSKARTKASMSQAVSAAILARSLGPARLPNRFMYRSCAALKDEKLSTYCMRHKVCWLFGDKGREAKSLQHF